MICPDCGIDPLIGEWPLRCHNRGHKLGPFYTGDSSIHTSERVTIYENAQTGDIKVPGRGDRPIHPKLAAAGYVARQIETHSGIRQLEKRNGLIHEASNYDSGSTTAEHDTNSV